MADQTQPENARHFAVQRIYIKDLSFESPNAPDIFRSQWDPKHELNINTKVAPLGKMPTRWSYRSRSPPRSRTKLP